MSRDYDWDDDEPFVVIEKESSMSSFLLGLAVGAGIALLFAPQSGMETRRSLARRAKRVRRATEDAVGDVKEKVSETFETARQRVEEKIAETRDAIETKREEVQRAVQAGREAAQQAREDLERRLSETKAAYNAGAQVARDARAERAERAERAAERAASPKGRNA
ncbi:MAG: YtxH domain-containing protein [Gemmatimonadaceae bacterium]